METIEYCDTTRIPHLCFNQGSHPAVFVHANGYPAGCYQELLQQLDNYQVWAPLTRACWPDESPSREDQWPILVEDLLRFVRAKSNNGATPMVGIGHSMGAVIVLMAALQAPQLFSRLVFIEPVFLPRHLVVLMRSLPRRIRQQIPLVKKTLHRPNQWSCLQQAFDFHRSKRAYRHLSDPALWHYIHGGTYQDDNQWRLRYAREWEAHFYQHPPKVWKLLRQLTLPTLALRAGQSEYLSQTSWTKWKKIQPEASFIEFNQQDHLLPMEIPQEVADTIIEFLQE